MTDIQKLAVNTSLKQMFASHCFSICTITELINMTGVIPDPGVMAIMRTQHCVHFANMPQELRDYLYKHSVLMFAANPGFDLRIIDAVYETRDNVKVLEAEPKQKGILQKLLGR